MGDLDHTLTDPQALDEVNKLIARRQIQYPRTARYLSQYFVSLAQRAFEKKTLAEHGRRWYEYWRSRDPAVQSSSPKILTRRMTRGVDFALDFDGVLPTDGVELLVPRKRNPLQERFGQILPDSEENDWLFYLAALLNSKIVKFLLKSTSDFWQGNFYAVRRDFLETVPIMLPSKRTKAPTASLVREAKLVASQRRGAVRANEMVYGLYGQKDCRDQIEGYLAIKS